MTSERMPTDLDVTSNVFTDGEGAVGGVVLAAGVSERFEDGNKLLATVTDEPIVRHSVQSLLDSELAEVVVVVGHEAEAVRDALDGLDVMFRHNEDYAEGQSTSVRVGVETALERGWDGVVFALGDMPFVASDTVDALRDAYVAGVGTILAPSYEGKRGNPVLFGSEHFDVLSDVTGDRGGRRLIEEHEDAALIETEDVGVVRDIDRERDIQRYTG
ncbi:nucleotidyltransferase family protein [Halorussus sp. AFM4]|uniref:nucleotidyltransferase family protein n=1 Tax=Halorussus sp. AFM4 TaxID=3421651 RepID=UPI003EBEDC04